MLLNLFIIHAFDASRVPELKIKLAGKSIPLEKYAIKKCEHFRAQGWLFMPALVISDIYLCDVFSRLSEGVNKTEKFFHWNRSERHCYSWNGSAE